jgi:peroxiredoxin
LDFLFVSSQPAKHIDGKVDHTHVRWNLDEGKNSFGESMNIDLIAPGELAPDFELRDTNKRLVKLSDYRGKPVVLAFLRGFMWPYCRAQLARMRDDYEKFITRGAEILAVGPDTEMDFQQYWDKEKITYIGLPDPEHNVSRLYKQQVNVLKLGRMPFVCVVDRVGYIRYAHYGESMSDIPSNVILLDVIDALNATSNWKLSEQHFL